MQSWAFISVLVGIIAFMFAVFIWFNGEINKKIDSRFKNPEFIKRVADEIRLPFLIFNKEGTFQSEFGGATTYIKKIEPIFENNRFSGFVVYPKEFLKEPPILQGINNNYPFTLAKRINTKDWKYRIPEFEGQQWINTGKHDEPPAVLFKLEIIR